MKLLLIVLFAVNIGDSKFLDEYPAKCDSKAALKCEYDFLLCKLYNGPANDKQTLCNCAEIFYGRCLRQAGVNKNKICF
jgi:hypothetical protein